LARLIGQDDPFADFAGGARPRARPSAPTPDTRAPRAEPRGDWRDAYRGRDGDSDRASDSRSAYSYGRRERGEHPLRVARPEPGAARRAEPDDGYDDTRADAYDPEYSDDAYLPEHGDHVVEPARSGRGRRIAIYVGALVIGIGVVGAAGVFGYRAIFGPTLAKNPPVISPQAGPNKVVPPTAAVAPQGTKEIYDRLGPEPRSTERIVPRTETPIDVAARTGRVPQPAQPAAPVTPADPQPVAATPQPPAPTPANLGPRRVRTVTVRADGTIVDAPATTPATPAPQPTPVRAAPAPRPAPAQPLAVNTYAATEQPQPETPRSRAPEPAPTPAPTSGPVWPPLQPPTAARPTGPVSQQVRVQTQTPTIQTPQTPSGYVVQVSSQRSEAEAQSAWRALQARYSAVLGSQQATIHRADLGDRGTFYRAQVGPFASRDEATRLCQNLKAAGGECIVQRN
jgi:hypothetical protein